MYIYIYFFIYLYLCNNLFKLACFSFISSSSPWYGCQTAICVSPDSLSGDHENVKVSMAVTSSDRPRTSALQLRFSLDPFPMSDRDASIDGLGVWLAGSREMEANSENINVE